jgi:hypothetical protein
MKKTIVILTMIIVLPSLAQAITLFGGFQGGLRTVNDAEIKDVYGNGLSLFPYLAVNPWKGLLAGVGYDLGYSKKGTIGLYDESTTLKISGLQAFVGYQYPISFLTPYALLGFGAYSYKQTVASAYYTGFSAKKSTFFFALGAKASPLKSLPGLFFNFEIKYLPLSVKPYDTRVDLGGLNIALGVGYCLGF